MGAAAVALERSLRRFLLRASVLNALLCFATEDA
jgi:hypothetical protein